MLQCVTVRWPLKCLLLQSGLLCTCRHTHTHTLSLSLSPSAYAATHCNALQHTTLHHTVTHSMCHAFNRWAILGVIGSAEKASHTANNCNTLQHTATHCNTLQHTATHCNTQHVGWAIEGAIGSALKVDPSYLSPNVELSMKLEAATKHYGVCILM